MERGKKGKRISEGRRRKRERKNGDVEIEGKTRGRKFEKTRRSLRNGKSLWKHFFHRNRDKERKKGGKEKNK